MIKVKIREEYKGKKIYFGGTLHDLSAYRDEQLSLIWEQNTTFRIVLEEVVELDSEVTLSPAEFEEALAKAGIVTSNVTAKRLAAYEKKRKSN